MFVQEMATAGLITFTTSASAPAGPSLHDVWYRPDTGLSGNAAAAGNSALFYYDGATWQTMTPAFFAAYIGGVGGFGTGSGDFQADGSVPMTGNLDLDGNRIILDADADTYIDTSTDDRPVLVVGGVAIATYTADGIVYPAATGNTGAAYAPDLSGNVRTFDLTLDNNVTFGAPTVPANAVGDYVHFRLTQDGTGSRTAAWNAAFDWGSTGAPTLSTAAGAIDNMVGYVASTTKIEMSLVDTGY
jgi:hypothetical protein